MKTVVFYSINAGLFLWNGQHGLLLDYLFDNQIAAWSDLPAPAHRRMLERSGEFSREHTLLFTHSHSDHYSRKYVQEYAQLYSARLYGFGIPESNLNSQCLESGVWLLELPGYRVLILETEHQGAAGPLKIENSLLCVETEDGWYVDCGDSVLNEAMLAKTDRWGVRDPVAAFVNYYHILPQKQREFLGHLQARRIFAIHFPFSENDTYNIKGRLKKLLSNSTDPILQQVLIPEPMRRIL